MSTRNAGLIADPLFVGATRPPMRWGVTYAALLCNMVVTIAQVSSTYGSGEAHTLVENCGNTLILRCSGSEHGGTSQFASRLIGEREVVRRQTSRAHDRAGWFAASGGRRSTTTSRQQLLETAVLAAEIEQLPDLAGFLKTAASPVWLKVTVPREG